MHKTGMLWLLLAHFVTSALLIDVKINVYPKHGSISGVFHAGLSSGYAFNASLARNVCEELGVVMADKAQVENALKHGFETCKYGWIDEQIAVIPRVQPKASCGKGNVGISIWRAPPNSTFDVFCFNLTDFEDHMNKVKESTTVIPSSPTSGAHSILPKTTRSASRDALKSMSYLPSQDSLHSPNSGNNMPELQDLSNTSSITAVSLIAVLMTVLAFLLITVAAVCYFKKNTVGRGNKTQQKENIETIICEKTDKASKAEVKKQHETMSNPNDVKVTIKLEHENGAQS